MCCRQARTVLLDQLRERPRRRSEAEVDIHFGAVQGVTPVLKAAAELSGSGKRREAASRLKLSRALIHLALTSFLLVSCSFDRAFRSPA